MAETVREAIIRIAGAPDVPEALTLFECMTFTPEGRAILDAIIYNTCPTCGGERQVLTTNRDNLVETPESDNLVILQDPCPDCKGNTHIISAELRERAIELLLEQGAEGFKGPRQQMNFMLVARGAAEEAVDAVLSTVFGHVRVASKVGIFDENAEDNYSWVRGPVIRINDSDTDPWCVNDGDTIAILDKEADK